MKITSSVICIVTIGINSSIDISMKLSLWVCNSVMATTFYISYHTSTTSLDFCNNWSVIVRWEDFHVMKTIITGFDIKNPPLAWGKQIFGLNKYKCWSFAPGQIENGEFLVYFTLWESRFHIYTHRHIFWASVTKP